MLESVSSFEHCAFSLSLNPSATTSTLFAGAFAIRCSERNLAKSALFSGNAKKFDPATRKWHVPVLNDTSNRPSCFRATFSRTWCLDGILFVPIKYNISVQVFLKRNEVL